MISADRGIECPACGDTLPPGRKRCDCGARFDKSTEKEKLPLWYPCDYCGQERRWYRRKTEDGARDPNRLIGRSINARGERGDERGFICLPCDQRRPDREFNWIDAKTQHVAERQDPVGTMIRASRGHMSAEDRDQIMQMAKSVLRKISSPKTMRASKDLAK